VIYAAFSAARSLCFADNGNKETTTLTSSRSKRRLAI